MVPELHAAYGFAWRKAAPRPSLYPPIGTLNNFLADDGGQFVTLAESLLNLIVAQLSGSFGVRADALLSRRWKQRTAFVRQLIEQVETLEQGAG